MDGKSNLIWFLVIVAICIYATGTILAIYYTQDGNPGSMPNFLSDTVRSMSLVFATNLGAVLGIAGLNLKSDLTKVESWIPKNTWKKTTYGTRILACYVYTITLVLIFIYWAIKGFTQDPNSIVALIPEMAKSLLGIAVGAFAAFLKE